MNNKILSTILFIIFLFNYSCENNKKELTIKEDKLVKIFFDLYAAQSIINKSPEEIKDSLKVVYTGQIFKIHSISKSEFENNVDILQNDPKKYKAFYNKLDKFGEGIMKNDTILNPLKSKPE